MSEKVLLEAGTFRLVEAEVSEFRLVNNEFTSVMVPVLRLYNGDRFVDLPAVAYSLIAEQVQVFRIPPDQVLAEAWEDYGTEPGR